MPFDIVHCARLEDFSFAWFGDLVETGVAGEGCTPKAGKQDSVGSKLHYVIDILLGGSEC